MNFGTNLRNLRIQRHLTQQRLADDLNCSQATITAYENGVREPSFEIVRRFAEYFHVAPSALMPFGEVSDDEYIRRIADSFNTNPKLRVLFDKVKNFNEKDLDAIIAVVESISGRRG